MTRGVAAALLLAALGLPAGCATSGGGAPEAGAEATAPLAFEEAETEVERAFLRGLVALKLGGYPVARRELTEVADACPTSPIGGHALLALAALELDPRNAERDPRIAREAAKRIFLLPEKPAWMEPAAETLYLLALELGGGMDAPVNPSQDVGDEPADETESREDGDTEGAEALEAESLQEGDLDGATVSDAAADPEAVESLEPAARPARDGLAERRTAHAALWQAAGERAQAGGGNVGSAGGPSSPDGCEAARERTVGTLRAPILPGMPLVQRLQALEAERDSLRAGLDRSEGQVAELRQELERIREALRP